MEQVVIRRILDFSGVVQGIGFRPTLFRLAREAGFGGWIQNRTGSVRLSLEGPEEEVNRFLARLPDLLPAHARVESITVVSEERIPSGARAGFVIRESHTGDLSDVMIPADLASCRECIRELFDPSDRRYGYAFTTCTLCGPRYTVVKGMPYDRQRTTMDQFPLCPQCMKEYAEPADRRFHAESTACPQCGPSLWMEDSLGKPVHGNPVRQARDFIAKGGIVAVRGIGGFLLSADALNRAAVERLRHRKARPHKPFAVMARDLEVVSRYCLVPPEAAALLQSPEAPIVILDVLPNDTRAPLPLDVITPDTMTLGVMLPTSPLHHLLMKPLQGDDTPAFDLLIMTSGNHLGEPICLSNEEARERLAGIADGFLMHDREIMLRNDDAVCVIRGARPQVWRRARGYAPNPIILKFPLERAVLAMGADMKNTVAVGTGNRVVLSPHNGDLNSPEALDGFAAGVRALSDFLLWTPECVAVDCHPDMQSRRLGEVLARERGIPVVEVQHHHAHAVACLAENGVREGLVLVMDGTGWGLDGTIWGAECLEIRQGAVRRLATFSPVCLPGGEAAIRRPSRQVVGRWVQAGIPLDAASLSRLGITREEAEAWSRQCERQLNSPQTRAAGRLFDSFAAALGLAPREMTYEGQPAIRLEAAARAWNGTALPEIPFAVVEDNGLLSIDWAPAFRLLVEVVPGMRDPGQWAMAFHVAVARAAVEMISYSIANVQDRVVGLSGGVFMNRILCEILTRELTLKGIAVLCHHVTPPGDGCIALGQAVVAGGEGSMKFE